MLKVRGMELTGNNWSTQRKACPRVILLTTNPTWSGLEKNTNPRDERPASNNLGTDPDHVLRYSSTSPYVFNICSLIKHGDIGTL